MLAFEHALWYTICMEPMGAWLLALFIVAMFVTIFLLIIGTMVWGFNRLITDHHLAACYKQILAEQVHNPSMPDAWTITYRTGRKQETIQVSAKTEAEALAAALKTSKFSYSHIVSIVKN